MSHTKIISPGELAVGQFITILEHDEIERVSGGFGFGMETITMQRPSWGLGEVFKVAAIELPYVAVTSKNRYSEGEMARSLDTRTMRLMELSPDYVKTLEKA